MESEPTSGFGTLHFHSAPLHFVKHNADKGRKSYLFGYCLPFFFGCRCPHNGMFVPAPCVRARVHSWLAWRTALCSGASLLHRTFPPEPCPAPDMVNNPRCPPPCQPTMPAPMCLRGVGVGLLCVLQSPPSNGPLPPASRCRGPCSASRRCPPTPATGAPGPPSAASSCWWGLCCSA